MVCLVLMLYYLTFIKGIICLLTHQGIYNKNNTVDLSRRHLIEIPQNIPIDTEILDLSYNEIIIIPNGIFANLSRLVFLNLSFNNINAILEDSFEGLSRLESLDLRTNQLRRESLRNGSFKPLTSLMKLYISDNTDSYGDYNIVLSDEIHRLRLLDTLYLDAVESDQGQLNKFECFKNLKRLSFEENIMTVTNKTFERFKDLPIEELTISNFRSAENYAFSFFPKLQRLTLHLMWASVSLEKNFPALQVFKGRKMTAITFTNNPDVNFFKLEETHLRYVWDICLKELNLASNNILDIDAASFNTFARKSTCLY